VIDSYRAALAGLLEGRRVDSVRSPTSVGSGWGTESRPFREQIGGVFVAPPGPRLLMSRARPVNVEYALASSLWILSGSDQLAAIAKFNPRGAEFTADGFTLSGAFGWRLREAVGDQLDAIVDLLRLDPSSRRAVGFIGSPEDLFAQGRDFPCASLLHAFLRRGELVMTVYMRSQSFLGVFPYDLVNFHYVQDYLARNLEASLGELRFTFGSLHVYEHEVPLAEAFLDDGSAAFLVPPELNVLDARAELSDWLRDGSRRAADVCTSVRAAWSEEPARSVS
jgi:thymidylate synthase